jgi:hypothetical protein
MLNFLRQLLNQPSKKFLIQRRNCTPTQLPLYPHLLLLHPSPSKHPLVVAEVVAEAVAGVHWLLSPCQRRLHRLDAGAEPKHWVCYFIKPSQL